MFLHREHLPYHHAGERRGNGKAGLDLDAGHREQVGEVLRLQRRIDEAAKPAL
jgi:hypothetical protein